MDEKFFVTVLAVLCCATLFAVDFAARIKFDAGIDKGGINLNTVAFVLKASVSTDQAGGEFAPSYVFSPENSVHGIGLSIGGWIKPVDPLKLSLCGDTYFDFADYEKTDFCFSLISEYTPSMTGNYFAEFGFTAPIKDFSDKTDFVHFDLAYYPNEIHRVGLSALNIFTFKDGKYNSEEFYGEASYVPFYNIGYGNKGTNQRGMIEFGQNRAIRIGNHYEISYDSFANGYSWSLFDPEQFFGTYYASEGVEERKVSVRYKYSKDNQPVDNGFFVYAEARNHTISVDDDNRNSSFTAVFEIGLYTFDAELGFFYKTLNSKGNLIAVKGDSNFSVESIDDAFNFRLSYAGIKACNDYKIYNNEIEPKVVKTGTGYIHLEYLNKEDNAPEDNGFAITAFYNESIGNMVTRTSVRINLPKIDGQIKPNFDFRFIPSIAF